MPGPAARLGDSTAHGGVIVAGFPMVLIGGMPAARIGDPHVCPMVTPGVPPIPHVGLPIVSPGAPTVLIGGVPAATVGSMAPCVGPPDSIIMGCTTVILGAAGGGAAGGGGGGGGGGAAATASAATARFDENESITKEEHWVEIEFVDKAGLPVCGIPYRFKDTANTEATGVLRSDGTIRRDALAKKGQCRIELMSVSDARWSRTHIQVGDTVKLSANAEGFKPNTKSLIQVLRRDLSGPDVVVAEIPGTVSSDKVKAEWKFSYEGSIAEHVEGPEKGYSRPEFYFVVIVSGCFARSGFLSIDDCLELILKDHEGNPIANQDYVVVFGDGSVRKGKLDGDGYSKEEKVPPTHWKVSLPNMPGIRLEG